MGADQKTMLKPPRLMPGDTVGIVAPSGSFDEDRLLKGVEVIESEGFGVFYEDDIFARQGYFAGPDRLRAASVDRMFGDPAIKAVICARGGFGALRILPLLDYEAVRRNPKIFMGFSDVSALLSVFSQRCALVVFHGPMATTLAGEGPESTAAMFSAIASMEPLELLPAEGAVVRPGRASGPVAGGNLTTLCHLTGTPYAPSYEGRILLLEDRGEAAYRIDRMLTQMKMAGCFAGLTGLVLGSFEDCADAGEIHRIFAEVFDDFDIPILAGFDVGHGRTNLTVPLGLRATLDTDRMSLAFDEPATT